MSCLEVVHPVMRKPTRSHSGTLQHILPHHERLLLREWFSSIPTAGPSRRHIAFIAMEEHYIRRTPTNMPAGSAMHVRFMRGLRLMDTTQGVVSLWCT
jgi:hypothetical protein